MFTVLIYFYIFSLHIFLGRACAHKQGLSKHIKAHKQCKQCGKYFNGGHARKQYASHIKRCGVKGLDRGRGADRYCSACDKMFDKPITLKRHREFLKCKRMQELEKERDLQEAIVAMDEAKKEAEFSIGKRNNTYRP